jgi:hypothetical protein
MFSTLATLVLLSFLLLLGVVLLLWSLIGFGTGPKAVSMPWGNKNGRDVTSGNPFIKKQEAVSSELVPDHISRGQIRTVKKPVSEVTLAEIKAITKDKVDKPSKTTTYEMMVKRAKHSTPSATKDSTPKDSRVMQTQAGNDPHRGANVKRTLVDDPILSTDPVITTPVTPPVTTPLEPVKPPSSKSNIEKVPPFIQINDLKGLPPLPPAPVRQGVTHSSKDTPVTKPNLPSKPSTEKPMENQPNFVEPLPEKKLWPAPLAPMVPKPALNTESKPVFPQPVNSSELPLNPDGQKPEAVPKAQSRAIAKTSEDPFEKFSKDKKDDTLF